MKAIVVHAKVNHILTEFVLCGGWYAHVTKIEGDLAGPDGQPLPVDKVMIHFNDGNKLIVEESLEDLERLSNGD